jgi:hypothetical protein
MSEENKGLVQELPNDGWEEVKPQLVIIFKDLEDNHIKYQGVNRVMLNTTLLKTPLNFEILTYEEFQEIYGAAEFVAEEV